MGLSLIENFRKCNNAVFWVPVPQTPSHAMKNWENSQKQVILRLLELHFWENLKIPRPPPPPRLNGKNVKSPKIANNSLKVLVKPIRRFLGVLREPISSKSATTQWKLGKQPKTSDFDTFGHHFWKNLKISRPPTPPQKSEKLRTAKNR